MNKTHEDLKKACQDAVQEFHKTGEKKFSEIIGNLNYCIGSYEFDKNPIGLHEYGLKALKELKKFKEKNPRKITKKTIEKLEKNLKKYEKELAA